MNDITNMKVWIIGIVANKNTSQFLFNISLPLNFTTSIVSSMTLLITFNRNLIGWKVKIDTIGSNFILLNHVKMTKSFHNLSNGSSFLSHRYGFHDRAVELLNHYRIIKAFFKRSQGKVC